MVDIKYTAVTLTGKPVIGYKVDNEKINVEGVVVKIFPNTLQPLKDPIIDKILNDYCNEQGYDNNGKLYFLMGALKVLNILNFK